MMKVHFWVPKAAYIRIFTIHLFLKFENIPVDLNLLKDGKKLYVFSMNVKDFGCSGAIESNRGIVSM